MNEYFVYTERAISGLKLFKDLSVQDAGNGLSVAANEMLDLTSDSNRMENEFDGVLSSHISYIKEYGLCDSISTFLLSYIAFFGEPNDMQANFLDDVFGACEFDTEQIKPRLHTLRCLHKC